MEILLKIASLQIGDFAQLLIFICVVSFCIRLIVEALWNVKPFQGLVIYSHEGKRQKTKSQEAPRDAGEPEAAQ